MNEQSLKSRHYWGVCGLLIALTIVTVGVSFLPLPSPWHLFLGLLIASAKASLVLLVFMHLYVSKSLTRLVAFVTACWLILLFGLTLADYVSRGLLPTMPGH
jgi:cytochrome c oxidase subunit IV